MSAAALELAPPPPPAAAPPAPASPTASFAGAQPPKGAGREGFLDAVRTIATLRVVVWHAFGAAAITWVVAAMPAMFFVTGSLLAKSLDRRGARTVLADRSRRLAAPLWAFGLVAWLAMAAGAWRTGTGLPLARALAWAAPFSDPRGTAWEGGWLSSHLWYLRALVWLLLAAPLLLRAVRARRALTFTVAIGAVFALDLAARQPWSAQVGHGNLWNLGDFALYSVFLLAGFVHRSGAFATLSRRHWLGVAGVAGASAAGWALTQPVPLGVVNNSHPLHLFVGAAWLALALAFQGPIGRLASLRFSRAVIRTVGQRSLTVYLWHTAAIIGGVELLERFPPLPTGPRSVALLALTTLGTMAAMLAFGWIEDLAGRRPARLWPGVALRDGRGRRPFALTTLVGSTVTLAMVGVACAAPSSGAATTVRPPVPSKQPPAPIFERVVATTTTTSPPIVSSTEAIVAGLDAVLASWIGRAPVSGALVGVAVGSDVVWAGAGGTRPEGGVAVTVGDSVRIASVTKLFTAALVYQYAEQGLINLDAPLPRLRKLPDFPYDLGITVNQLLSHTSGLIDYHGTDIYRSDPAQVDDPLSAIRATLSEPLEVPPGTEHVYSSTNYLILGLLLEQVSGRTYDQLLQRVFLGPLDLDDTVHHPASLGQPNFSTGGIETSIEDLLAIGTAILRDHTGFSEASYNLMTAINATSGAGAGAFGYCPCTIDQAGNAGFFAVGHTGGTTVLAYAKALDMTIAVDLSESLWEPGRWDAVVDLFRSIQALSFTA